jgi:hypothetical protein
MYRIIEGRGTGKTSRLMLLAKENDAIFVCSNPDAMKYKASKYGIDGLTFISYGEYFVHRNEYPHQKYVVDELENFLQAILFYNNDLIGYTLSVE